nr:hypothetical protein [Paenibacillus lautus]
MLDDRFAPDERTAVGIRFDLGAVHKVMFQFDVILLGEKLKQAREDLLQYVFHRYIECTQETVPFVNGLGDTSIYQGTVSLRLKK